MSRTEPRWVPITIVFLGVLVASACSAGPGRADDDALREALRRRIETFPQGAVVGDDRVHSVVLLPSFYRARAFQTAWTESGEPGAEAIELIESLGRAAEHGLDPADYHVALLQERLEQHRAGKGSARGNRTGNGLELREDVDLELLLTDAFFTYAAHLVRGKTDPEKLHADWKASRRTQNLTEHLETALRTGRIRDTLIELEPQHPEYARLRNSLGIYQALADEAGVDGDWIRVPDGGKLEPGRSDSRIPLVRKRLAAEGYLPAENAGQAAGAAASSPELYDPELADAVLEFQRRHGLDPDGVIGAATCGALNRGARASVDQIRINLERWRWLPETFAPEHIRVNIAAFQVFVYSGGELTLTIPCIVGKTARKSPIFTGLMTYLVINPTWTVPVKLALQDKLPLIRKDPEYLQKNGFEVFRGWGADAEPVDPTTIDWNEVGPGNFPYRLRQRGGEKNALGRIKFMFPNPYDVYLHDTPSRELFAKSERTFSSGCIRVRDPLGLATFLLRDDKAWNQERIEAVIQSGEEKTVFLKAPVPVHLLYWTAWSDESGQTFFRKDVYDRDDAVLRALNEPPPEEVG